MDMTDSYRQTAPDISKADFFDFVTSNDLTDAQYKEQMRSVNVFMESPESHSNPLLSDEPKEQNNNGPPPPPAAAPESAPAALQSFDSIWNVDRERDRLESAMLEDLNKYYWSQEGELAPPAAPKLGPADTDGQIYTLTVLNQDAAEPGPARYWCKEEEVPLASPNPMDQIQQSSLDLESILDIMPNQINGFTSDFNQDALTAAPLAKVDGFAYEDGSRDAAVAVGDVIKVESFGYEEGEEELRARMMLDAPLLDAQVEFNDNNNDWKLSDRNGDADDSLLRSALQGKAFIRYGAAQKTITDKLDSSCDLKRVIVSNNNNNKSDVQSMYAREGKEAAAERSGQLVMTLAPTSGVNIVLFEEAGGGAPPDSENPTPTQSVDDILLSQLDAAYPEDFEKLKRIANEVAESVQQFCTVEQVEPARSIYNVHHLNGELLTMIPAVGDARACPAHHLQIVTASPAVSSSKSASKKYKRAAGRTAPGPGQSPAVSGSTPSVQTATSTSNGVRKERSLHYCSICSKGFKDKYSVNVHVRTHTGEKPFSCSLCGKSFRQKAHLAKHYQTHIAQKNATANGGPVKSNKQR